ncbi:MAG: YceI family protein [Gammaproteobacteria bacterium]|nr:YceI family protein [Gammaproteobacteria bacterium]
MKTIIKAGFITLIAASSLSATAADYVIDTKGMHAAINFRIQHLGYSWLYGQFRDFTGQFSFDENNPDAGSVSVNIDTTSIDSNHAERDKHLRSDDFLATDQFPAASFTSTSVDLDSTGNGTISGDLTLKGNTRPVTLEVKGIGAGNDPWGGYRRGFEATTELTLADFGIDYNLGPAAKNVELILSIEGVRQ